MPYLYLACWRFKLRDDFEKCKSGILIKNKNKNKEFLKNVNDFDEKLYQKKLSCSKIQCLTLLHIIKTKNFAKNIVHCNPTALICRRLHYSRMIQEKYQQREQGDILRLISDQHTREIINVISSEPRSAVQISKELNTEISTIYRRLHKLEEYDLLQTTFQITPDGKKSFYYKSKINSINASYQEGKFNVILEFN